MLLKAGKTGIKAWNNFRNKENYVPSLEGTNLTQTKFDGSNLQGANLKNALIDDTSFLGVDLQYADLTNTDFHYGIFSDEKPTNTNGAKGIPNF
ncbi:MAG: pentapeptide repeat-containing protein [Crocosphaera sp.]|nr:pentapeptide repeat-containing protein [Crocosphaera sp.]